MASTFQRRYVRRIFTSDDSAAVKPCSTAIDVGVGSCSHLLSQSRMRVVLSFCASATVDPACSIIAVNHQGVRLQPARACSGEALRQNKTRRPCHQGRPLALAANDIWSLAPSSRTNLYHHSFFHARPLAYLTPRAEQPHAICLLVCSRLM
jgi:hypothetical protein